MKRMLCTLLGTVLLLPALTSAADPPPLQTPATAPVAPVVVKKIDLNRATLSDLISVPGIGPSTAQSIVDLRTKKGAFSKLEELIDVKGIGTKKLAALAEYLIVVPSTPPPASSTSTPR